MIVALALSHATALADNRKLLDTHCADGKPTLLETATASAAYLANVMGRPHSIKAQSARLLREAFKQAQTRPDNSWVEFTSTPELDPTESDRYPQCAALFKQTAKQPLRFATQTFKHLDDLNQWIANFTQGQGIEGKQLYKKCPGKCSPQYRWWIRTTANGYTLHTTTTCGLPRNKTSNRYQLKTRLWSHC